MMALNDTHHLPRPRGEGDGAGHVDLAPDVKRRQAVGRAGRRRLAVFRRIFEHHVPPFRRNGEELNRFFQQAALKAFRVAVEHNRLIRVRQTCFVRPHVIHNIPFRFVQNEGVFVRG